MAERSEMRTGRRGNTGLYLEFTLTQPSKELKGGVGGGAN